MNRILVIASNNRDKAAELADLLRDLPWRVCGLAEFDELPPEPEETGDTFEENALLKADYYFERLGLPCAADDSGLEVDALNGEPGVLSARYAGPGCSYADNNDKLLSALRGVPEAERAARFVCCAAFSGPEEIRHAERGTVEGRIAEACRGGQGFGYDPLFIPEGHTQTFGEMPPERKHELSHRGRAFRKLRTFLETLS